MSQPDAHPALGESAAAFGGEACAGGLDTRVRRVGGRLRRVLVGASATLAELRADPAGPFPLGVLPRERAR
jgi:hypothetical protein